MRLSEVPFLEGLLHPQDIGEDQSVVLGPRLVEHAGHAERPAIKGDAVAGREMKPGGSVLSDQRLAAFLRIHARSHAPPFLKPLFRLEVHSGHQHLGPFDLGLDQQLRRDRADVLPVLDGAYLATSFMVSSRPPVFTAETVMPP